MGVAGGMPMGGMGGAGGSIEGVPALDWNESFEALYRFETSTFGEDASENGNFLELEGQPEAVPGIQGMGAARFPNSTVGFYADHAVFEVTNEITFGGWFRAETTAGNTTLMGRYDIATTEGYRLRRLADGAVECRVAAGDDVISTSVAGVWPDDDMWHHVICRFTLAGSPARLTVFFDGVSVADVASVTVVLDASPTPRFEVGYSSQGTGFFGDVDDLFVHSAPLSDPEIRRIFACGSDGSACRCDALAIASYTFRGRLEIEPSVELPPCNSGGF